MSIVTARSVSTPKVSLGQLDTQAHVWLLEPSSVHNPEVLARCRALLCASERQQYQRFYFPDDAHHYLVSHALLRSVLSRYVELDPEAWRFYRGAHGRPEIDNRDAGSLRFNLTHTRGMAALVVTARADCGIDTEQLARRRNLAAIAKRMFSAHECAELERRNQALDYFYTHWTLREAYVKAKGIGLSFPTRKLRFETEQRDSVTVEFEAGIDDTAEHWQFELLRPGEHHIVAVALASGSEPDKTIVARFFEFA